MAKRYAVMTSHTPTLRAHLSNVSSIPQVLLPSDIEGIVILNIASYGSGMNLWGSNPISLDEEGRDLESSFS